MRPSQTFVGSEAQGYLLLMALFVRPALAVIGLFAAMLVADPVVDFITQAFFSMQGRCRHLDRHVPGALVDFITFAWWMVALASCCCRCCT
jgi:conjugal transfer/type IV secretion protein DotA/TraY